MKKNWRKKIETYCLIGGFFALLLLPFPLWWLLQGHVDTINHYLYQSMATAYIPTDRRVTDETTDINTISMGADLQFTATQDDISIRVSVLTDLNGDSYYEWIDSASGNVSYLLSSNGTLVAGDCAHQEMTVGQKRTLSATELLRVGMESEQRRVADGRTPLSALSLSASGDLIYYITIQHPDADDEHYFVQLDYSLDPTISNDQLGAGVFQDVPSWAWYWDNVDWAVRAGLLNGNTATTFLPEADTSRAALMQVLYTMAGSPDVKLADFSDVTAEDWYANAVSWGATLGLVGGYSDGSFQPNTPLTREQLAVIIYKAAQLVDAPMDTALPDLNTFSDGATTSSWATSAVCWAVGAGILDEQDGGLLNPQSTVSRATLASVLMTLDEMNTLDL